MSKKTDYNERQHVYDYIRHEGREEPTEAHVVETYRGVYNVWNVWDVTTSHQLGKSAVGGEDFVGKWWVCTPCLNLYAQEQHKQDEVLDIHIPLVCTILARDKSGGSK